MQLTERHIIKPNNPLYTRLDDLTLKAKNLYNAGLYAYRQSYFEYRKGQVTSPLSWQVIDKQFRQDKADAMTALPSKVASAVLKSLGEAIRSYWRLVKGGHSANLPRYLHKQKGRYIVSFNYQTFAKERGPKGELILCPKSLALAIPTRVEDPQQVRIVPRKDHIVVEVVYQVEEAPLRTSQTYAGIDLGIENFATLSFSNGQAPLILKGLELKSLNQGYHRLIAKAQAKLPKGQHSSQAIHRLWSRRHWILQSKIHQMTAFLATLFDEMNLDTVVIGKNAYWKTASPLSKVLNQGFVSLPYNTFIEQLTYKCRLHGIRVILQEESYTSKASFLDGDVLPVYGEGVVPTFSGRRIQRGLYRAGNGQLINADVNAAYNILRKGLANLGCDLSLDHLPIQPRVVKDIGQVSNPTLIRQYVTLNV